MNCCFSILSDSLDKKIEVLKKIQTYNEEQEKAFVESEPDMESFDVAIEEKEKLIQELIKLDQGFEAMYERVKVELDECRSKYKDQIIDLQKKITVIAELTNAVQAKEARNKMLIENYFAKQRVEIKQSRQRAKVAYGYQQNMMKK